MAIGGGGADGDDLFGDVQLACVCHANDYDWCHPEIEWRVVRMARNMRISRHRKSLKRKHVSLDAATDATSVNQTDRVDEILEVVGLYLSRTEKEMLFEHAVIGLSLKELAEKAGVSEVAMRLRWMKQTKRLAATTKLSEVLIG